MGDRGGFDSAIGQKDLGTEGDSIPPETSRLAMNPRYLYIFLITFILPFVLVIRLLSQPAISPPSSLRVLAQRLHMDTEVNQTWSLDALESRLDEIHTELQANNSPNVMKNSQSREQRSTVSKFIPSSPKSPKTVLIIHNHFPVPSFGSGQRLMAIIEAIQRSGYKILFVGQNDYQFQENKGRYCPIFSYFICLFVHCLFLEGWGEGVIIIPNSLLSIIVFPHVSEFSAYFFGCEGRYCCVQVWMEERGIDYLVPAMEQDQLSSWLQQDDRTEELRLILMTVWFWGSQTPVPERFLPVVHWLIPHVPVALLSDDCHGVHVLSHSFCYCCCCLSMPIYPVYPSYVLSSHQIGFAGASYLSRLGEGSGASAL